MGLIKTALKTAVAVKTAHVVHDRIERRKRAEWVASGHTPESFPTSAVGDAAGSAVTAAASWLAPPPPAHHAPPPTISSVASAQPVDPVIRQLQDLADLRDRGVLTEDEFAAQKRRLLGP